MAEDRPGCTGVFGMPDSYHGQGPEPKMATALRSQRKAVNPVRTTPDRKAVHVR